jgi:hypothetical protein
MSDFALGTIFYFGCMERTGHYLHDMRGRHIRVETTPFSIKIDGGFCPSGRQAEGQATVSHLSGWTAVSFWDRSVDERPGSNSSFVARGNLSFDQMMALAREHFPQVIARLPFPVIEAHGQ